MINQKELNQYKREFKREIDHLENEMKRLFADYKQEGTKNFENEKNVKPEQLSVEMQEAKKIVDALKGTAEEMIQRLQNNEGSLSDDELAQFENGLNEIISRLTVPLDKFAGKLNLAETDQVRVEEGLTQLKKSREAATGVSLDKNEGWKAHVDRTRGMSEKKANEVRAAQEILKGFKSKLESSVENIGRRKKEKQDKKNDGIAKESEISTRKAINDISRSIMDRAKIDLEQQVGEFDAFKFVNLEGSIDKARKKSEELDAAAPATGLFSKGKFVLPDGKKITSDELTKLKFENKEELDRQTREYVSPEQMIVNKRKSYVDEIMREAGKKGYLDKLVSGDREKREAKIFEIRNSISEVVSSALAEYERRLSSKIGKKRDFING